MSKRKPSVIGKCYNCQGPVTPSNVERIRDFSSASQLTGLPPTRLAHRGECADAVKAMIERGKIYG